MDITYNYLKLRKNFGHQPMFCEVAPEMLDSIEPDKNEQKKYGLRNPVHKDSQASTAQSEHYVNTKRIILQNSGLNHSEGGWPKDIHYNDEEATSRYRRRIERDDTYIDTVLSLYPQFEHYIKQNNGLGLYNIYFKEIESEKPIEKPLIMVSSAYKDILKRPISSINWTYEDKPKLVVSYCNRSFPEFLPLNSDFTCYIWDLENPGFPASFLSPPFACWQIVCSPESPSLFMGGLDDGTVCIFDTREKREPVAVSPAHLAHRDPVSALVFIPSRQNLEFFSGSTDGLCMWWDIRNLQKPTDALVMSVRIPPGEQISLANSEGVSAMQYDKAFPTKFLCGTDTGLVINVNRKGKSHQEMMSGVFNAHDGPVKAVHRSPCTSKVFITCGDWRVNIWSEEVLTSPIVSGIRHKKQVNDVSWAPNRYSGYMSVGADGKFRFWDLLRKYREPVAIMPVSQNSLLKVKPNEEGRLVACGDVKGDLYLLILSETMVSSGDKDKALMTQTLERETRRERILENRIKEIMLKLRTEVEQKEDGEKYYVVEEEEESFQAIEDEYRRAVTAEIRHTGVERHSLNIDEPFRTR